MPTYKHVDLLLDILIYPEKWGLPHMFTILYATIKKSIKTTISGIIARWISETWKGQQECIYTASDADQSKGRGYQAFRDTLEKHPKFDTDRRELFGPNNERLWRVTDKGAIYYPSNSRVKPVSSDYAGEAGANPTATFYTELWAWRLDKDVKFYSEMTVPPTRPKGFRFIDTYAGYRGVSNVLWPIWRRCKEDGVQISADSPFGKAWNAAMRLTIEELKKLPTHKYVPDWEDENPPIWYHLPSRTIAYIDQGIKARRFKWQLGEEGEVYYMQERAAALTVSDYLRLHENEWAEPVEALMPIEWYDNCLDKNMRPLKEKEAVVGSVDASVTHDCTAAGLHSRHPDVHHEVALRDCTIWNPQKLGGEINYDKTILPWLVEKKRRYNIVQVVYDKYQLKYLMDRVAYGTCGDIPMSDGSIATLPAMPVRSFNQQNERRESDSMLVSMIRDRQWHHNGDFPELREQFLQAAGRHDTHENTKLHIEKRDDTSLIDGVIMCSMGNYECHRLGI